MAAVERVRIMDAAAMDGALERIAREIGTVASSASFVRLVGVRTRGVPLARRLADKLAPRFGSAPPVGVLDINLYRDDLSAIADHPVLRRTEIPFDVAGAHVVLVDDVLYTGRTVRAALDGLMDLGRPRIIQLAVLVDRGHRELPIRADFVGLEIETSAAEQVEVRLVETDGADEVSVLRAKPEGKKAARRKKGGAR